MIISFDGPAGSGKSTVAKLVAKHLGFIHFNSGSIFRAITAFLIENNFNTQELSEANIKVEMKNNDQFVFVNNVDYTPILRNNEISKKVAEVSALPIVQFTAQKIQKEFSTSHNVVIEGRGIGSEVLPNAEYKFYLDCSIKERAKRRFLEDQSKNPNITLKEIEKQLEIRDKLDKERDIAPLVIPENAIIIDSSNLTIEEVVEKVLSFIKI
jgi:cytidylate kinase